MCDPAGQTSDGFHFLCLAKLFFEQLALADILRDYQMDGAAGIFQLVSDDFGIDHFSIFANVLPVSFVLLVALREQPRRSPAGSEAFRCRKPR